jgi:hypothetical protein
LPLLSFSETVTISLGRDQPRALPPSESLTHISSPSLRTVPIPHSTAYRLSSLRSLAITYLRGRRPLSLSLRSGSPWMREVVHLSRWKTGRPVCNGSGSGRVDLLRRGFLGLVWLRVVGKYGSGGTTTFTPSPKGSGISRGSGSATSAATMALASVLASVTRSNLSLTGNSSSESLPLSEKPSTCDSSSEA